MCNVFKKLICYSCHLFYLLFPVSENLKMVLQKSPDWMKLLPVQRRDLMNQMLTSDLLLPIDDIQSQLGGRLQNVLGLQEKDLPKALKLILAEIGKHFALLKRGVGGQETNKFPPVTSSSRYVACSRGSRMMEAKASKELHVTQQANANAVLETKLEEIRQFSGAAEVQMENTIIERKQNSKLLLHKETLLITLQILRERLENLEVYYCLLIILFF